MCVPVCPSACAGDLICTVAGAHEAVCSCESDANCPDGQKCDLETKQCVAADCASVLLATRPDVEVVTDAESFRAAQRSKKDVIAIVNDIPRVRKIFCKNRSSVVS